VFGLKLEVCVELIDCSSDVHEQPLMVKHAQSTNRLTIQAISDYTGRAMPPLVISAHLLDVTSPSVALFYLNCFR
jgi:hypothetical protein